MSSACPTTLHSSWIALLVAVSAMPLPLDPGRASAGLDSSTVVTSTTDGQSRSVAVAPPKGGRTAPSQPDLMLAEVYAGDVDLAGYWVSEKLDGVRAYWTGRQLLSRSGRAIQAPAWFTRDFPPVPLDGELWMGRGGFERVSGAVRRKQPDPAEWSRIRYMVFDLPDSPAPFGRRLAELQGLTASLDTPYLEAVAQLHVSDRAALMERLARIEQQGGEGLMLHRDRSLYRGGRSGALLKVKSFSDAEARVVAHIPGRGRLEGMLGSILVEDEAGRRFRIGSGFSDAERRDPPPVGSLVTFKFQGRTERGIPRFASFMRVREGDE